MKIIAILLIAILLAPTAAASSSTSELSLTVTYDDQPQATADLIIENKINDEVIELNGVDLSVPIDLSGISPVDGDYIKITAILDPNDPTKIQTICVIFLGNMILHGIHMKSNLYHMGEMYVENTGNSIDWDTQNLLINNFPPVTTTLFATGQLGGYVDFSMTYDRNDNWLPQCDEGWRWQATYTFTFHDPINQAVVDQDQGILSSNGNTFTRQDGGFCTDPDPAETEEEDPPLKIRLYSPAYPGVEFYDANAHIYYESHYSSVVIDRAGNQQWQETASHFNDEYKPDCLQGVGGWCYTTVEVTWS